MKNIRLIASTLALLGFTASPFAASIDFDDFNAGAGLVYGPRDYYRSLGVVFSRDIPFWNLAVMEPGWESAFTAAGGTLPNEVQLSSQTGFEIDLSFVLPGTTTPATTDFVQVRFMDFNVGTTLGTIQAFDASNQLLATDTRVTPSSGGADLYINAPGIAWVRFSVDADGGGMDNFLFTTPVVPEPSGLALALLGIGALFFTNRYAKRRGGVSA